MLLELCFCMTLHDERGGFNQMLLKLCFCMNLHAEKGGVEFNQLLLERCRMTPQDDTA